MSEISGGISPEAASGPQEISHRDKALALLRLWDSSLDGWSGLLKLHFGLQTGAVVLLLKVLTDIKSPVFVMATLSVSILLFALAAISCLDLLTGVAEVRSKMISVLADARTDWSQEAQADLAEWKTKVHAVGRKMTWMFRIALLFSLVFVAEFLFTH